MKKFAGSKLELYLLKNEVWRVYNGYGFLYEEWRIDETEKLLNSLHQKIALRRVKKAVYYRQEEKSHAGA